MGCHEFYCPGCGEDMPISHRCDYNVPRCTSCGSTLHLPHLTKEACKSSLSTIFISHATSKPALGQFGHHPDPAIDFCTEVNALEALAADVRAGEGNIDEYNRRREFALAFRVGGDEGAIAAMHQLRGLSEIKLDPKVTSATDKEIEKVRKSVPAFEMERRLVARIDQEIETRETAELRLRDGVCDNPVCTAVVLRKDDGSRVCSAGHPSRWIPIEQVQEAEARTESLKRELRDERDIRGKVMVRADAAEREVASQEHRRLNALDRAKAAEERCGVLIQERNEWKTRAEKVEAMLDSRWNDAIEAAQQIACNYLKAVKAAKASPFVVARLIRDGIRALKRNP